MHPAQPEHAQLLENRMIREASGASRRHLMAPPQESANRLVDIVVRRPVGHQPRAVAKVVGPASQEMVQPVAHFLPWRDVGGNHIDPARVLLAQAA